MRIKAEVKCKRSVMQTKAKAKCKRSKIQIKSERKKECAFFNTIKI